MLLVDLRPGMLSQAPHPILFARF